MMAAVVFCCFGLYLFSPKLQPRLKFIFSAMYIWSVSTNIMIQLIDELFINYLKFEITYNLFEILLFEKIKIQNSKKQSVAMSGNNMQQKNLYKSPNFFFGFNSSALIFGIMQFSDNKLKLLYTVVTPLILIFLFEVYTSNNLQFILHSVACISFVSVLTYMFEYIIFIYQYKLYFKTCFFSQFNCQQIKNQLMNLQLILCLLQARIKEQDSSTLNLKIRLLKIS